MMARDSVHLIRLKETRSTNSYLQDLLTEEPNLPGWTVVVAEAQHHGRGQKGNSWESAPRQNLTLSLLLRPHVYEGMDPFDLCVITSVALCRLIRRHITPEERVKIKWPNDIYVGDKKIAGILIENQWMQGCLSVSVIGIGLNVNQRIFLSDAPNPTSLAIETNGERDLLGLLDELLQELQECDAAIRQSPSVMRQIYHGLLYRFDGRPYPFRDSEGDHFDAIILGVSKSGKLSLKRYDTGAEMSYAFKEISYIILA